MFYKSTHNTWWSKKYNIKKDYNKFILWKIVTRKRLLEIGCYCPPIYKDPWIIISIIYYNYDVYHNGIECL